MRELEQPRGCDCPVVVFAFDRLGAGISREGFDSFCHAEAVGCADLKMRYELNADTEVPGQVKFFVLVHIGDCCLRCEECEAGTGEKVGSEYFYT